MKRAFLSLLVLLSSTYAQVETLFLQQESKKTASKIVVAPISYKKPTSVKNVVHYTHLRESLIFQLKNHGFAVASDSLFSQTNLEFPYVPIAYLQQLKPQNKTIIQFVVEEQCKVIVSHFQEKESFTIDVSTNLFFTEEINSILSNLRKTYKWQRQPTKIVGEINLDILQQQDRLDWGFEKRLKKINSLLTKLNYEKIEIQNLLELAIIFNLHGSYFWNTDRQNAYKYFGKSLAFIEQVHLQKQQESVKQIYKELKWLAVRFSGEDQPLDFSTKLAETNLLKEYLELEFLSPYPTVKNTYDFFIRMQNRLLIRNYDKYNQEFVQKTENLLDVALISNKVRHHQYINVHQSKKILPIFQSEFLSLLSSFGVDKEKLASYINSQIEKSLWLMFTQNPEMQKQKVVNGKALYVLSIATLINKIAGTQNYSNKFHIRLQDVYSEMSSRYVEIVILMKKEQKVWGQDVHINFIDKLFHHYGPHLIPKRNFLEHKRTEYQKEIKDRIDQANELYYRGHVTEAFLLSKPLLEILSSDTAYLYQIWELWLRSGQDLDKGIHKFAKIWDVNFKRGYFRKHVQGWKYNDFSTLPKNYWLGQTNDYYDYLTRAEYAFRNRQYQKVMSIVRDFHYGKDSRISFMETIANIMVLDRNNSRLWRNLKLHFENITVLEDQRVYENYHIPIDHRVRVLNEECGDNIHWKKIKEELLLEYSSQLSKIKRSLNRNPKTSLLKKLYKVVKEITAVSEQKRNIRLLADSLQIEHQILARILSDKGTQITAKLLKRIIMLVKKTSRLKKLLRYKETIIPRQSWFLCYMYRFGANENKIIKCYQQIAPTNKLLSNEISQAAFTSPQTLIAFLDTTIQKNPLDQLKFKETDIEKVFKAAYLEGNDNCAMLCALDYCTSQKSFALMACYFENIEDGKKWIKHNSLDRKIERNWLNLLEKRPKEITESIIERVAQKPLPEKLMNVYEYINR
ncbi:hypothetical protein [Candidatus Uabimicrobium sp. HlEnr_7]|uniref:hypothetical protein n=1 Tax=Candidatus Uabimicrobium helgolandensis TaxID=3095367 RepID=UPI0035571FCA